MLFAHYSSYGDHMSRGDSWVGALLGLLLLLLLAALAVYAIRTLSVKNDSNPGETFREPLDIAKERFAKGEISKEELAEIRKELR